MIILASLDSISFTLVAALIYT